MADLGFNVPNNGVAAGNYRVERLAVGANATAAKMIPGALVVFDTNDHDVKESGAAGDVIGFLGYEDASSNFKPTTRDTAYVLQDEVPVLTGTDMIVTVPCASTSFVKGDYVEAGASGVVVAATIGTNQAVGQVVKSTSSATTVWIRSLL